MLRVPNVGSQVHSLWHSLTVLSNSSSHNNQKLNATRHLAQLPFKLSLPSLSHFFTLHASTDVVQLQSDKQINFRGYMQQPKSLSSSRAEYDNTVAAHLVSLLSELLWLFVVSIVVVGVCNVDTCNISCVGPTVMDDIVTDFAAVCRPFEVAYKLPDNIADALSATATRGSSATWRRSRERGRRRGRRRHSRTTTVAAF